MRPHRFDKYWIEPFPSVLTGRREILFLIVPPIMYFAVAVSSRTNLGVRHILPIYAFLSVFVAGAAWAFIRRDRRWAYVFSALMVFQVVTSLRLAPDLVNGQIALMNALQALGRPQEALSALEKAVALAKTVEPEYQELMAARLEQYWRKLQKERKK